MAALGQVEKPLLRMPRMVAVPPAAPPPQDRRTLPLVLGKMKPQPSMAATPSLDWRKVEMSFPLSKAVRPPVVPLAMAVMAGLLLPTRMPWAVWAETADLRCAEAPTAVQMARPEPTQLMAT